MDNDFDIYEETSITPSIDEFSSVKGNGNPLQMRGLCHVIGAVYQEGMDLNELEERIATVVQAQISKTLETFDQRQNETIMNFLNSVDNNLTLENNKVIREENGFTR